jgi:hypothetical protein
MVQAHRYALTLKLGRPIADGYMACHTCNRRYKDLRRPAGNVAETPMFGSKKQKGGKWAAATP